MYERFAYISFSSTMMKCMPRWRNRVNSSSMSYAYSMTSHALVFDSMQGMVCNCVETQKTFIRVVACFPRSLGFPERKHLRFIPGVRCRRIVASVIEQRNCNEGF